MKEEYEASQITEIKVTPITACSCERSDSAEKLTEDNPCK